MSDNFYTLNGIPSDLLDSEEVGERALKVVVVQSGQTNEPSLGNPDRDGAVLASTQAGERSWVRNFKYAVLLQQPEDFNITFRSDVLYYIDGIINLTGTGYNVEVPAGGVNFRGLTFDVSQVVCSDANYSLFTTNQSGGGNISISDVAITTSGLNSQVFSIESASGDDAVEMNNVNFNGCTSLGYADGYRQWFESGTGRFGGTPYLEFRGAWAGGCFIDSSIVRGIGAMNEPLFKAGANFTMQSRFRSNQNVDLGSTAAYLDFSPANFPNPDTLQLEQCLISRGGVFNSADTTITPNINPSDLPCKFKGNVGIKNTFEGGSLEVTAEQLTVIPGASTFVDLLGTWSASDLQHFDSPANGQLRNLGVSPIEFTLKADMVIDGGQNDELEIRVRRFNSSDSTTETVASQVRQVNNFVGGRDVAFFNFSKNIDLQQNDYLFLEIANNTDGTNVTAENGSTITIGGR